MILKYQESKNGNAWVFISNIDSIEINLRTDFDPKGKQCNYKDIRMLRDKLAFGIVTVHKENEAYLLTDEGKTIEKIN